MPRLWRAGGAVPAFAPPALAVVLCAALLLVEPVGTDLAAQVARARFWSTYGAAPYDLRWYGGTHPPAYSVLTPPLMSTLGVYLTGAVAAIAGAALLGALLRRVSAPRPLLGALWGAVVLVANLGSGRVTFAVGVALGLGALCVLAPLDTPTATRRGAAAAALAALTSLASPVAGLFVALCGVALIVAGRRGSGLVLAGGAAVPLLAVQAAFADGGRMPFSWAVARPVLLACLAVLVLVGLRWRLVAVATGLYAAGVLTTYAVPNALGSNVERLALLFTGPVIAAVSAARRVLLLPVLVVVAYWQIQPAWHDLRHARDPTADRAYFAGLVGELRRLGADTARVEVVPLRNHWEAVHVADAVALARGWQRQLDLAVNPILYDRRLNAASYRRWLAESAVGYVALATAPLDWSATAEARLLRDPPAYLQPVWRDAHWRLWRVTGARPLADPPATVDRLTGDSVVLTMPAAGSVTVRVRWSPWVRASRGGCVEPAGPWMRLHVDRAGTYVVRGSLRAAPLLSRRSC